MRIRLTLKPADKKAILPINYNYYLTGLIYRFIFLSSKDYSSFLHNEGYRTEPSKKGFKLFTYSMLNGEKYSVKDNTIIFEDAPINWEISSPVDVFLQHLITGAFTQGQIVNIGNNQAGARFLIEQIETVMKPDFKETMRFTCLSPITVSKIYNKVSGGGNGNADLGCHYIRPWEESFSQAIEQNLIKKYRLIHGKLPAGYMINSDNSYRNNSKSEFKISIDSDYMNRRGGKITKKINFKNTEIIGFMAPFEVTGNPELIEIGYEAGFGEKGSIGCGMVRECYNL